MTLCIPPVFTILGTLPDTDQSTVAAEMEATMARHTPPYSMPYSHHILLLTRVAQPLIAVSVRLTSWSQSTLHPLSAYEPSLPRK